MAHQMQFEPVLVQEFADALVVGIQTKLFVNVTVRELMEGREYFPYIFRIVFFFITIRTKLGYTDKLIELATLFKPGTLKDGKFGILQPVSKNHLPTSFHLLNLEFFLEKWILLSEFYYS